MEELEYRTPNGLHDAYLSGFAVSYVDRLLQLHFRFLVGLPDGGTHEEREAYKDGTVTVRGLQYFVIEGPGSVGLDQIVASYKSKADDMERARLPEIKAGSFRHSFCVGGGESFLHFCAESVSIEPADLLVREVKKNRES